MAEEAPNPLQNQFVPTVTHTRCARSAVAVTPDNSNDLTTFAYFGLAAQVAGTVKVDMIGGGRALTFSIAAGIVLPIQVRRVYATGTTATGIIALLK